VVARNPIVRSDCVVKRTWRASRSLWSRTKTKNFLTNPFSAGGVGGAAKKMKGNFMVLFPPLHSSRKGLYLYFSIVAIFCPPFLPSFASVRGASSPRLVVSLSSAHTSQTPRIGRSHSFAMPARCCFVFALWLRWRSW